MSATIDISKTAARVVNSRHISARIAHEIIQLHTSVVLLDFADVDFVSRSAAHALELVRQDMRNITAVQFINVSEAVQMTFQAVERTINVSPTIKTHLPNKVVDLYAEDPIFG